MWLKFRPVVWPNVKQSHGFYRSPSSCRIALGAALLWEVMIIEIFITPHWPLCTTATKRTMLLTNKKPRKQTQHIQEPTSCNIYSKASAIKISTTNYSTGPALGAGQTELCQLILTPSRPHININICDWRHFWPVTSCDAQVMHHCDSHHLTQVSN